MAFRSRRPTCLDKFRRKAQTANAAIRKAPVNRKNPKAVLNIAVLNSAFKPRQSLTAAFGCWAVAEQATFAPAAPWIHPRAVRSQRLAHANSMARIPKPAGMTRKAGPGNTSNATPNVSTVVPATAIKIRLTLFIVVKLRGLAGR